MGRSHRGLRNRGQHQWRQGDASALNAGYCADRRASRSHELIPGVSNKNLVYDWRAVIGNGMPVPHILCIEDDRDTGSILEHVLIAADYTADVVATVAAAMQRLTEHRYGLVIADWRLADGHALPVLDRAAELGMKTAILTGYAFHISQDVAAHHEVWLKPMRPTELIEAIQHRMGRTGA